MCAAWCHQFAWLFIFSYLTYVIFRSYGNHVCKQHNGFNKQRRYTTCAASVFTLVHGAHFPVLLCLMSLRLGSSSEQIKKAGNKNINKPNYTRARSLFCVQTTPGLPMNGQGPHTDPCCSLTWYNPEKKINCDWSLFFFIRSSYMLA